VEKNWPTSIRSSRRIQGWAWEEEGVTRGGMPTAAEAAARRGSSARDFLARKTAKFWSSSCSRRRESYWVVGLDGEGAEGWVRREHKLTGEEVATVRWFRWGSGRKEWPRSVSGVRGSSPGGCSGAGRAEMSCPRQPVARRCEGKAAVAFRELGVCVECKRRGNGSSAICWCCWAEEGG
jgi:hypothetical protein